MNYLDLPVYKHKDRILSALKTHQAVVVESPTGSGKTTQLPVILHDAGYCDNGVIGVTQPRRIAAVSVSEFIARQMGTAIPGLVGFKMRFEDKTDPHTKIKIMTDGILLQEMKLDPYLSKYCCIIVDEAHERSLNIDFVLGLLKRVLEVRAEFKVLISSATINAQVFSAYFGGCPIVKIEADTYPVTVIYDPPAVPSESSESRTAEEALLLKIIAIVERVVGDERPGDILIFLSGEKLIKECMSRLSRGAAGAYLHIIPLYGRLGKEEQERVFESPPPGKIKAVISTNIAETSVTIDGVTTVIDSGMSKLNYYSPRTFTSSLVESPISKASANQRRGRAGRTRPGTCYRLYSRRDFEGRPPFTAEEIYRTDLSEVVLRMADLGLTAFEEFDFIAPPNRDGLISAVETLRLLDALEDSRSLSKIGKLMTEFPLSPRESRIIVEALLNYPNSVEDTLIAVAFLSTQSPYLLPPGEELDARMAHHRFRDDKGDFVSYLKLYRAYKESKSKAKFCDKNYLDEQAMAEIENVVYQLGEIVSAMQIPILSGGSTEDYLCAIARGLIQFVCIQERRGMYRSLTADRILIHPGSVLFRTEPQYIVAGEIIKTTRMYAMSVSPLSRSSLDKIKSELLSALEERPGKDKQEAKQPKPAKEPRETKEAKPAKEPAKEIKEAKPAKETENVLTLGEETFEITAVKKKKIVLLPWERLVRVKDFITAKAGKKGRWSDLRGTIIFQREYKLLAGEKLGFILSLLPSLNLDGVLEKNWSRKTRFNSSENLWELLGSLPLALTPGLWKADKKDLGFLCLLTDGNGNYWFTCSRGFSTSLNESLASLETLIDELGESADPEVKQIVSQTYRRLSDFLR
ncbi:MAG: ATP-dependent RNA helicase [Spirochaetaceae bacterium]|jgi:RNA helicase HrpA|nr:ATP-dependent RNA helicase [Spirochaetaceae bacterium]